MDLKSGIDEMKRKGLYAEVLEAEPTQPLHDSVLAFTPRYKDGKTAYVSVVIQMYEVFCRPDIIDEIHKAIATVFQQVFLYWNHPTLPSKDELEYLICGSHAPTIAEERKMGCFRFYVQTISSSTIPAKPPLL